MDKLKRIVVIGASAGGLQVVTKLVSSFPTNFETAVFIVLHLSKNSVGEVIVQHLQRHTKMVCSMPKNGDKVKTGHVYIAPPDHHMLLTNDGTIGINNGPNENRWRPSIDVLFRSAAVHYTSGVIGIVLSGLLDDGTSGSWAIKQSGGVCIVQEPTEAEFSDMPANVLNNVDVDFQVPIADMAYILADLLSKPASESVEAPEEVRMEAEMTEKLSNDIDTLEKIADHSRFICPDCGGGLWKIKKDGVHRYRCHTGHVYTEKVLLQNQNEQIEESIWVSVRLLEERRNLLLTIAAHDTEMGNSRSSAEYHLRAEQMGTHIDNLKSILQGFSVNEPND